MNQQNRNQGRHKPRPPGRSGQRHQRTEGPGQPRGSSQHSRSDRPRHSRTEGVRHDRSSGPSHDRTVGPRHERAGGVRHDRTGGLRHDRVDSQRHDRVESPRQDRVDGQRRDRVDSQRHERVENPRHTRNETPRHHRSETPRHHRNESRHPGGDNQRHSRNEHSPVHPRNEPTRYPLRHRRPINTPGPAVAVGPEQEFTGVLELISSGSGFLRRLDEDLQPTQGDVFVPPLLIQQKGLQQGMLLHVMAAFAQSRGQSPAVTKIIDINNVPADSYSSQETFRTSNQYRSHRTIYFDSSYESTIRTLITIVRINDSNWQRSTCVDCRTTTHRKNHTTS